MDKQEAIHSFWSSFGLQAYDQSSVPDDAMAQTGGKYISYSVATSAFNEPIPLTADLWYRSVSWAGVVAKANEIEHAIGRGGVILHCDGGAVWILKGSPFSQRMTDVDDTIRRIYLNIIVEFLTED